MPTYSDCNAAYRRNAYPLVFDVDAVMQSIYYLLHTRKGEKFFDPTYGTDLHNLLFDLMLLANINGPNLSFGALLRDIEAQEPRVKISIKDSSIRMDPDNHILDLNINFQIVGLPTNVHQYREIMSYNQG